MRLKHILGALLSLGLLSYALYALFSIAGRYRYEEIVSHLHALPWWQIGVALALTGASYLLLTGYDALALLYLRKPVAYRRTALASFVGYTFSNNLGFALLTGTSVRYRLYSLWGLKPAEIAQLVVFCSLTFFLGLFLVGGVTILIAPPQLPENFPFALPALAFDSIAWIAIATALLYLLLPLFWRKPLKFSGVEVNVPPMGISSAQYLIAGLDWIFMSAVFYVLLPPEHRPDYALVLTSFMFGNILGVLAHVPGGLGVFEGVVVALLQKFVPVPQLLGALIAYRMVYYVLPFMLALMLFGGYELLRTLRRVNTNLQPATRSLMPPVLAVAVFICGALVLFSGATPTRAERLELVAQWPLAILESAHFFAGLVGMLLVLLARNLVRHSHYAYRIARWLLPLSSVLLLIKGLNIEAAIFVALIWLALLPSGVYFTRRRSLFRAPFGSAWFIAIGTVMVATLWLSYFSFRQLPDFAAPWLEIAAHNEESRALRALLAMPMAVLLFSVVRLFRPRRPVFSIERDIGAIRPLAQSSNRALTQLALLGDKRFLLSPNRGAFLMYVQHDRSLIVLGDPVGDRNEFEELLWQFRELADKRHLWPVVYQAGTECLSQYFDVGLIPHKLGDEARVALAAYTPAPELQGALDKARKEQLDIRIVTPAELLPLLPQLEQISATWLQQRQMQEKAFAVGHFDSRYIAQFPHALIYCAGQLIGFATVLPSSSCNEVAIDLIRYSADLPAGGMELLFDAVMQWSREQGHQYFNLGLVPVSDWVDHPLAVLWHRIGRSLLMHSRAVETPEDLRAFKLQFAPQWQDSYLLSPADVDLYPVLANISEVMLRDINESR